MGEDTPTHAMVAGHFSVMEQQMEQYHSETWLEYQSK